ncbi:hypothetical protein V1478_005310 [Vespula squamosa]|uniref:Uncharacterized protein n=1 Tax=Vespula squamosa TaxID=30214 RepID=A0ABD2BDS0_VESSQ
MEFVEVEGRSVAPRLNNFVSLDGFEALRICEFGWIVCGLMLIINDDDYSFRCLVTMDDKAVCGSLNMH